MFDFKQTQFFLHVIGVFMRFNSSDQKFIWFSPGNICWCYRNLNQGGGENQSFRVLEGVTFLLRRHHLPNAFTFIFTLVLIFTFTFIFFIFIYMEGSPVLLRCHQQRTNSPLKLATTRNQVTWKRGGGNCLIVESQEGG